MNPYLALALLLQGYNVWLIWPYFDDQNPDMLVFSLPHQCLAMIQANYLFSLLLLNMSCMGVH